jgi:hypothetical protein
MNAFGRHRCLASPWGRLLKSKPLPRTSSHSFQGGGIYRDFMTRDVPIVRGELIVDAPSSIKLQYRVHHLASIKIGESDNAGRHHLAFDQAYTAARSDSDIDLPSRDDQSPMIEFSTGDSWATVSSAYRQLAEAHIDPEKVKPLLTGMNASTRTSRIEQIVARLHKEIRYTGIEFGEASIQPAFAADILKRHYGDCKDKAAVLVAMLRGSGIPASLALLATGPGRDVTPDLPGMDQFDHAIVYVPAASGADAPAMWIDATAEYTHVGDLPGSDQGREALIIAEDTTGLTITPTLKPEDDHLTEVREVVMAPYGPAHITETSFGGGEVDADYRSYYGAGETREARKDLETYARDQYLAKALNGFDHSDGKDLTKAFTLKLDMAEARRGNTDIEAADVGIPYGAIFSRLPQWFRTDPKTKGEKLTEQQEEDLKRAAAARTTEYEVHPFLTEWKYRITPASGFRAPGASGGQNHANGACEPFAALRSRS